MELSGVRIKKPEAVNFILGQSHFIKTVEDIHEAMVQTVPNILFGAAFCEASGPRLIRYTGTDNDMIKLACSNAEKIAAGHHFIIFLKNAFPVNVLPALARVPEICRIFCATANETEVIVAQTESGRGILGVIDGKPPLGIEDDTAKTARHDLLRAIGYKQ